MVKKKTARKSRPAAAKRRAPPVLKVAAAGDVPAVGQSWPGSKDIRMAEIKGRGGAPNYHLLLVCGKDGKPVIVKDVTWGEYGATLTGADSSFDGLANTEALLKAGSEAAKKVRAVAADGYLPAIFELQAICANNDGLLPLQWFWSSTQYGANSARYQNFENGSSGWASKDYKFHALVVRRVLIQ